MSKFSDAAGRAGKVFNVVGALKAAPNLHKDVPLAYNLLLDPATPLVPKLLFGAELAGLGVALALPDGGALDLLLATPAFRAFIKGCEKADPTLVAQHRAALDAGTSTWDQHVAKGVDLGKAAATALVSANGPLRGGVRRVTAPGRDLGRAVAAPVKSVVRRLGGRGGSEIG